MSHLTTYKNNFLDKVKREMLIESLKEIGIELDFSTKSIHNTWIDADVDAAFKVDGKIIAAGLKFSTNADGSEKVDVVADFYGTGFNDKEIIDRMSQIYTKNDIVEKCNSQRWFVSDEDVTQNENGDIIITATRYAE